MSVKILALGHGATKTWDNKKASLVNNWHFANNSEGFIDYNGKKLRIEKGASQVDVAKLLNMSKMAISHWEKGHSEPSISQLIIIADFFIQLDVHIFILGNLQKLL